MASKFDFSSELKRTISMHPVAERPMLNRLCRSFIDLVFVLDQLDCTLVDIMLYPDDVHQKLKK